MFIIPNKKFNEGFLVVLNVIVHDEDYKKKKEDNNIKYRPSLNTV